MRIPRTEIDALYHGPDWTPRETFMLEDAALAAQPTWVTEWHTARRGLCCCGARTFSCGWTCP